MNSRNRLLEGLLARTGYGGVPLSMTGVNNAVKRHEFRVQRITHHAARSTLHLLAIDLVPTLLVDRPIRVLNTYPKKGTAPQINAPALEQHCSMETKNKNKKTSKHTVRQVYGTAQKNRGPPRAAPEDKVAPPCLSSLALIF